MNVFSRTSAGLCLLALAAAPGPANAATQDTELKATMSASTPTRGPDLNGVISARRGDRLQITSAGGTKSIVGITDSTRIAASTGLFGLGRNTLAAESLQNGLPVSIRTLQAGDVLIADRIRLRNGDLKTVSMIHGGTAQGFEEQSAATAELRGRVGDIDQYNVKSTTIVNFDTGKAALSQQARADLCATASDADAKRNALLLVVGYTDSTGSAEFNQRLSERRAAAVVNHMQQACGWKPYRMLTPAGMSMANPIAPNDDPAGKAQNRRVAVEVLVSKAVDGL